MISNLTTMHEQLLRTSAPNSPTSFAFLGEALAVTLRPYDLAIWIAYMPTLVLPPLMKIDWPGSCLSLAISKRAWYAVKPTPSTPAASLVVRKSGRLTISPGLTAMYWARAPLRFLIWTSGATKPATLSPGANPVEASASTTSPENSSSAFRFRSELGSMTIREYTLHRLSTDGFGGRERGVGRTYSERTPLVRGRVSLRTSKSG